MTASAVPESEKPPLSRAKAALLVVLASVLPHLYGIGSPLLDNHYQRQTETAIVARNFHENGAGFLRPRIDWAGDYRGHASTEFPLYMYLVGKLWGVLSLGEMWGRVLSVVFSALTALLLLLFLEAWLPPAAAVSAAALFGLIPIEVYFGRTVQPEAAALFFTMAALLLFDRHLLGRLQSRPAWGEWVGACASASLAIGLKLPYAYLLGVCAVLAWARLGSRALREPGVLLLPPASLLPAWLWYQHAAAAPYGIIPVRQARFLGIMSQSWRQVFFIFKSRFPELAVGWPGMLLWAAGAWSTRGLPSRARFMLWGWFACLCLYIVGLGYYAYGHEYVILPFALVNAALMGLGLNALLGRASQAAGSRRRLAFAGLALLLAGLPVGTALRIKHWYRLSFPYLPRLASKVEAISSKEDLFVIDDESCSVILFHIKRRGWTVANFEQVQPRIDSLLEKIPLGAKFYVAPRGGAFRDRGGPEVRPIFERFPLAVEDEDFLIFRLDPMAGLRGSI